jgi:hypothetical protein
LEFILGKEKGIGSVKPFNHRLEILLEVKEALINYVAYCYTSFVNKGSAAGSISV